MIHGQCIYCQISKAHSRARCCNVFRCFDVLIDPVEGRVCLWCHGVLLLGQPVGERYGDPQVEQTVELARTQQYLQLPEIFSGVNNIVIVKRK